ncbi:dipeptide ABC transporter ATP-binding protein [Nocardia terpenica]|uniref:ABC transporter ATP-binding protein n=1 Tax=Nocardia terpenica TaxID=455432 RepID=A0A164HJQ5_9NOCA|nr:ABC transporter ATP-binding protein [Nocardia terpenica]KZM68575.1 ABC transporter ATP-binding protein [Nocardia terpenica]NQE88449.1 ABC transporter ATP-binding protein [Nocardia terpenica]
MIERLPEPLLRVEELRVRYPGAGGPTVAVDGVSLTISRGETVALVGESGSGKSTLAHAVIGLRTGAERTGGRIVFDGERIDDAPQRVLRRIRGARIGLVPQDPGTALNPVLRIGDQVAEALRIHGRATRRTAAARAVEILTAAGLDRPELRARQYPQDLSGGQRQRALIGIALACGPQLIIADEPTSALDVTVQRHILDHLATRTAASGTAVLLITHDLGVAADRADRIIVMHGGRIVEIGTTAEVLTTPRHDYTRQLLASAPGLDTPIHPSPTVIPACFQPESTSEIPAKSTPGSGDASTPGSRGASVLGPGGVGAPGAGGEGAAGPSEGVRPLVSAQGLRKAFRVGGRTALTAVDGVSLHIDRGETLGVVGESGSGKTTTARILARLERADSGSVTFDGQELGGLRGARLREVRRRIQVVYQNPYASLNPRLRVGEIIAEPLRAFGVGDRAARRERVAELLDQVALPVGYGERRPGELSGGQRQRVAIARALAPRPELVVLDEPVSALDVSVQAQILDLLERLRAELGPAYLFITHDLAVVRRIADRVAVMRAGRIVETAPTAELFDSPRHEYTRELLSAIPGTARTLTARPAPIERTA